MSSYLFARTYIHMFGRRVSWREISHELHAVDHCPLLFTLWFVNCGRCCAVYGLVSRIYFPCSHWHCTFFVFQFHTVLVFTLTAQRWPFWVARWSTYRIFGVFVTNVCLAPIFLYRIRAVETAAIRQSWEIIRTR